MLELNTHEALLSLLLPTAFLSGVFFFSSVKAVLFLNRICSCIIKLTSRGSEHNRAPEWLKAEKMVQRSYKQLLAEHIEITGSAG